MARLPAMRTGAAKIYEAGVNHLARYAATEASLARVLARKVERWVRLEAGEDAAPEDVTAALRQARSEIPRVIARLRELGVLNDAAFAASRAKRLTREGKSRRATMAHLAAKGIKGDHLLEDPECELAAACAYVRRRRAGPFGNAPELKILAAMARGGFTQEVAKRALRMDRETAEQLINLLKE